MARTLNDIQSEIIDNIRSYPVLSALGNSASSIWRLIVYIISYAAWTLEVLFDLHSTEVSSIIADMKPHTARWYATKAKLFQFGSDLIPDSDQYDNTDKTDEEIAASRIVAYSAVVELERKLLIKVAKEEDDLGPLDGVELKAFSEYISRIKDAGVQTEIISEPADNLRLSIDIYYNPLVLDALGQRLDGTNQTPVADAIRAYLKNLPFNGQLVLAFLTDAMQAVDGVVIPHLPLAEYRYGELEYRPIDVIYQPNARYIRIADEDLDINYIPQSQIF